MNSMPLNLRHHFPEVSQDPRKFSQVSRIVTSVRSMLVISRSFSIAVRKCNDVIVFLKLLNNDRILINSLLHFLCFVCFVRVWFSQSFCLS